jgi:monodictyphenone polyketide synthase
VFGAEAVRVAFRMGVHVLQVSQQLEARDPNEAPGTWAYVVHNVEPEKAQAELDAIHESGSASSTGKIFISAVSRTSVTVSGPPAVHAPGHSEDHMW